MKKFLPAVLIISVLISACASPTDEFGRLDQTNTNSNVVSEATVSEENISENIVSDNSLSADELLIEEKKEEKKGLIVAVSENEADKTKIYTFSRFPESVEDLEKLGYRPFNDPCYSAAVAIASLCNYENDPEATIDMMAYLNGTEGLTDYERALYHRQLDGMEYKAISFLAGATPDNYYQYEEPIKITIYADKYTYVLGSRVKLFAYSSGSAAPRAINVRYDEELKKWCVYEHGLLGEMREPGPILPEDPEEDENTPEASNVSNNAATEENSGVSNNMATNENSNSAVSENTMPAENASASENAP